jgi:peptide deformylase
MRLTILTYPKIAPKQITPVDIFDDSLQALTKSLHDLLITKKGKSLAAPQVGILKKIFVMNESSCFINPKIVHKEGEAAFEETCLSFPGVMMTIPRNKIITIEYQDEMGVSKKTTLEGIEAHYAQQALDHLQGIFFIDYLSNLKRERLVKKFDKIQAHLCMHEHEGCDHDHH